MMRRATVTALAGVATVVLLAGCTSGPDPRLDAMRANRDATFEVMGDLVDALPGAEWEGSWQPWVCMTDPESYAVWLTGDIAGQPTPRDRAQWLDQIEAVFEDAGWDPEVSIGAGTDGDVFAVRSPERLGDQSEAGGTGYDVALYPNRPARFTVVSPCVEGPRWLFQQALEDSVAPW